MADAHFTPLNKMLPASHDNQLKVAFCRTATSFFQDLELYPLHPH